MTDESGLSTQPSTEPSQDDPAVKPAGPSEGMPNKFADQTIADAQVPYILPRAPLAPPSPPLSPDPPPSPWQERSDGSAEGRLALRDARQKFSSDQATVDRRSGDDRRQQAAELPAVPQSREHERAEQNEELLELLNKVDAVRDTRNAARIAESNLMRALIAGGWTTAERGPEALKEARTTMEEMLGMSVKDFLS